MKTLVLLRHGESEWNLENRFTGWTDVDLTPKGVDEARTAGRLLKADGYHFDVAYTSYLKRANRTLALALEEMGETDIPVVRSWKLNERHYGALQDRCLFPKIELAQHILTVAELIDERHACRHVHSCYLFAAQLIKIHYQGAQRIAVRGNDDTLSRLKLRPDFLLIVRDNARYRVL